MKMKLAFCLLFFCTLLSNSLLCQTLEENKVKYNNGKELFKQGKWELALNEFRQVAAPRPNNPYNRYASYFYMACAAKLNKFTDAKLMATQIENKYPDWDKLNEVRFLLAEIAFKERDYEDALSFVEKIRKDFDEKDLKAMSVQYLSKINSLDSLKTLQGKYKDNPYLGEVLAKKIQIAGAADANRSLLNEMVKKFKLDTAAFASSFTIQGKKKPSYNVALLLPFNLADLNPESTSRANFYALDLYEGIRLGVEQLAKKGIKINLYTFDTGRDNAKLSSLLSKGSLLAMDLIVGPVTNAALPEFDNFLQTNKILAVNPVGTNSAINANTPLIYLNEATVDMQGRKAAEFIHQQFAPKRAAVFYGATPKDSLLAISYRNHLVEKGSKVIVLKKITRDKVKDLSLVLSDTSNYKIDNIFISSSEQAVAANFVSEVEKNGYKIPVVASPQWINYTFFNLDQFARLNFYFVHPDFVDYSLPAVQEFREIYKKGINIIPGEFSFQGYDLINYFGNALWNYGTSFQSGISSLKYTPGVTTAGYDYSNGNTNSVVPVVKFQDGVLHIVNYVDR